MSYRPSLFVVAVIVAVIGVACVIWAAYQDGKLEDEASSLRSRVETLEGMLDQQAELASLAAKVNFWSQEAYKAWLPEALEEYAAKVYEEEQGFDYLRISPEFLGPVGLYDIRHDHHDGYPAVKVVRR